MIRLELYIDKGFLRAFFLNVPAGELCNDFIKFLRKKPKNIKVITNYASFEEMKADDNALINHLIDEGAVLEVEFNLELTQIIHNQEFYRTEVRSPFRLFFIESDCSSLSEAYGFEFISSTNFAKRWAIYNSSRNDCSMVVTNKEYKSKFDSWQKLRLFEHPVHSVIINDNYVLGDKKDEKIKNNLILLLENLLLRSAKVLLVNITICSKLEPSKPDEFIRKHKMITDKLDLCLGKGKYTLNIINNNKEVHSRFILTNYFYIDCVNSFNFFKENGTMNYKDTPEIRFQFIFSSYRMDTVQEQHEVISEKIAKVENSSPSAAVRLLNFYPNKVNRLCPQ